MKQVPTTPFKVGQRFYYTGDMANRPDFGEITEVQPPGQYSQLRYMCKFESGRHRIVEHLSFNKSVGQRFKPIEQYNEERQQAIKRLHEQFPHLGK